MAIPETKWSEWKEKAVCSFCATCKSVKELVYLLHNSLYSDYFNKKLP